MSSVLVEPVGRTLQMATPTLPPATAATAPSADVDRSADVSTPTEGERKGFPLHDDEYFGDEGATEDGEEGEEQQWIPMSWMRRFVVRNFACHLCRRMPHDPVLIVDASRVACRECSQRDGEEAVEGPPFLTRAITDLQGALVAARNARRPEVSPLASSKSLGGAASSGGGYVDVANLEAAVGRMSVRRTAAVAPPALTPAEAATIAGLEAAERVALMTDQEAQVAEICKRHANRVRKARGGSSRVLKSEADERYETGEYAASVELYSRAIAVNDGTVRLQGVHGNRSAAYFMTGQFNDCVEDCLRAVELDAANAVHVTKMLLRATKAAMQLADTERALKFLQRLRDMGGASFTSDTQTELARVEKAHGILKEVASMAPAAAEERLRMLATDFPEAVAFRLRHASHLIDMGRYRDARQQLDRVGRTGDAAQLMARAMYSSGFEEFAAAREVLAQHPTHAGCKALLDYLGRLDGHKQHGNDLFSSKRFAEAIDAYSEGIKLEAGGSPRLLRVLYCNRAAAYKEIGKYKEGVEDCTKALEFDPKFAKAYARRGRCLFQLDAFRGAVRDFKSSLELEPRDTAIQSELRMAEKQVVDRTELEKDLYAVLAVARTASNDEIRSAFRRLSLQYHPDKTVGLLPDLRAEAERKFKIVNDAYTTLTDAAARRQYDLTQQMQAMRRATAGSGMGGAGPGAFGSAFAGMGGMYGGAGAGAGGAAGGAANRGNYWRQ